MYEELPRLEAEIADPHVEGFFRGFRVCHAHEDDSRICCRGFWARHKNHFTLGQIAQRLGWIRFVGADVDAREEL